MKSFNLSEWALRNRSLVTFFMLMIVIAGIASYFKLGRSEDPDFTVKTMVVARTGRARRSTTPWSRSPTGSRGSCRRRPASTT